jgi:dienelactone hydrolase
MWSMVLALAAALPAGGDPAPQPAPWGELRPGPYEVGVRVLAETDPRRTVKRLSRDRPLQVTVWVPAAEARGRRMTNRDYLALRATELGEPGSPDATVAEYTHLLVENGVPEASVDRWLRASRRALAGAPEAPGPFPLVLIAQGNMQSAYDQVALGEHLAGHGYVVATCPSQTRISGPMASEDAVTGSAEEQADDLEFLRRLLRRWPTVDDRRLGVVGHSFGARSALLFAMGRPRVGALVSLDGGIGARTAKGLLERSKRFRRDRPVPVLHVYEDADEFMAPDFDLLRSLRGPRLVVHVQGMHHPHFTSMGAAAGVSPEFAKALDADADTPRRLAVAIDYTRRFHDAWLRGDGRARKSLDDDPTTLGLPAGLLTIERWPGR